MGRDRPTIALRLDCTQAGSFLTRATGNRREAKVDVLATPPINLRGRVQVNITTCRLNLQKLGQAKFIMLTVVARLLVTAGGAAALHSDWLM